MCSLLPLASLAAKNGNPFARYLQVDCRFIGQVVQKRHLARFGNCHFNLGPLVPLIEGSYRDKIWLGLEGGAQRGLVVLAVDAVSGVLKVPGSHARVDVAGPHAGDEEQVVVLAEGLERLPVALGGAVGEAVGGKVGVDAVEARRQDVPLVLLLDQQGDEDGIVRGVPDAAALRVLQEFGPLLRVEQVGVVDVKERKELPGVGPVLEEGRVVTVPEDRETVWAATNYSFVIRVSKAALAFC